VAIKESTEQLHSELQRLFDESMSKVGWSYPID